MNLKKVPQLFIGSGAAKWNDPKAFPWSIGWQLNYQYEGRAFAEYILKEKPDARIAVSYQNDDLGRDYLKGLKEGLGKKAATMIVAEASHELSEPTIDNHIVKLRSSGADVLVQGTTPKFAAQGIKKVAELGWRPMMIIGNVANSVAATIKPAGFENAQGVITAAYLKDVLDPEWQNDPGMIEFQAFMDKDFPQGNKFDSLNTLGYSIAQTLVQVLKQCGDELTRENIMKQATNLKDFRVEMLLPGIKINTTPNEYAPVSQLTLMRFKGERWERFGEIRSGANLQN
jgi:branched-chain amino acid transport system substrate-binding protein